MSSWDASHDAYWWNYGEPVEELPKGKQDNLSLCECGATVTYGTNIPGYMHSTYCPMFKDDRQKKEGQS